MMLHMHSSTRTGAEIARFTSNPEIAQSRQWHVSMLIAVADVQGGEKRTITHATTLPQYITQMVPPGTSYYWLSHG